MQKASNLFVMVAALVVLIPLGFTTASAQNAQNSGSPQTVKIELTKEEKIFLKAHPVIRIGTDYRWEPYVIKKLDGSIEGFDIDLIRYINEYSGINIEIVTGLWSEMVELAKQRQIDGLAISAAAREREPFFNFSQPYISSFPTFVVAGNSNLKIYGIEDFKGKSIAILKGNQFYLNLLGKYPSINIIESLSEIDAIKLTIEGKVDAAIVATTVYNNYYKIFPKQIKVGYVATDNPLNLVYSIRKDWPELVSIINKALASLPQKIKNSLYSRWFGFNLSVLNFDKDMEIIPLTAREKAWTKEHPEIKLGVDPAWQPIEFIDKKGQHQGVSSDYVRILNRRLGLNMKIVPNLSWPQIMKAVPEKAVDVLPGVAKTLEREKYLNYSQPYIYIDWVIISDTKTPEIRSLADLKGRVTAVDEGYPSQYRMEQQYPGIPLIKKNTTLDVLQSVIEGEAEAAVVERNAATMIIHGYRIHSLKIDQHVFENNDPIAFAVRKDWPELVQILNKGLLSIAQDERDMIEQKWLAVPITIGFTKMDMLKIVFYVIAAMGILLVYFLFWNRRQQKEIGERIKAEQALEASYSLMKIGESIAQLGFFERNWQTEQENWSEGFCRLLGFENPEVYTHGQFAKYIHKNDRQRVKAHIQETLETKTSMDIEFQIVRLDENILNIHGMGINTYDNDGMPLITRGTFQDISARKQSEEEKIKLESQLQQSQKMESIGTLAGGIAHDFNNMLGVISGNISYALTHFNEEDELYGVLFDVEKSSKQAQNLTHQLLTFSKGGAPIKKLADINALIKESAIFSTRGTRANCSFELLNELWVAEIDDGQINQVMGNLLINANQAMPDGGTITIRTENAKFDRDIGIPLPAGKYVKIMVEDQGVGISGKDLSKVFDPYFSTKKQGSGLGLASTYSIIKKHGGYITACSAIDKGTIFNIYLPASSKTVEKTNDSKKLSHTGGQGRILIMDDQEMILKMVSRMLERIGYETEFATDGAKAIESFRKAYESRNPFDLVILDLTVPGGMGGAETIPELLRIDPELKAVVSSGYSNDPIMSHYQDYGFCGVVPKPFTMDQLAKVLNQILGKTQSRPHDLISK